MSETIRFIQETERAEPKPRATLADARQYIIDHLHEPEFKNDQLVLKWTPIDALPSFEMYCNALRANGSPELYRARELTHVIDVETGSGGWPMKDPMEIYTLLAPDIGKRYDDVPRTESLDKLEAGVTRDHELRILNEYEAHPTMIEPILSLIEGRVAWIDHEIEREDRTTDKDPRDERDRRRKIKTLELNRKKFRRARTFLLNQYFPDSKAR